MQDIHPSVWCAPSAQLFGKIALGEGVSIWHNAVLRAECQEIRVGRMTNVQDFVMIHVPYDRPTVVGAFCSMAWATCAIMSSTDVAGGANVACMSSALLNSASASSVPANTGVFPNRRPNRSARHCPNRR